MPQNCVVFLLPHRLTRLPIYGSKKVDSNKWPTVLIRDVKWKACNFEWYLRGSLYSTFKTSFQPYTFHHFFIDQLVRSKATCSVNSSPTFLQRRQFVDSFHSYLYIPAWLHQIKAVSSSHSLLVSCSCALQNDDELQNLWAAAQLYSCPKYEQELGGEIKISRGWGQDRVNMKTIS